MLLGRCGDVARLCCWIEVAVLLGYVAGLRWQCC